MLNFKKVITRDKSTEDENSGTSQGTYNKKVNELRTACKNFRESVLNKEMKPEYGLKEMFDEAFKEQMKKSQITSRTSRKLHKMSKNLSTFKGPFEQTKAKEYAKALHFDAKKPNKKGYIKRSAIDDEKINNFFNSEMIEILRGRRVEVKAQKTFEKAERSLEKSNESIDLAKVIIKKIDKIIKNITEGEINEKAKNTLIQRLNKARKNLEIVTGNAEKQNEALDNNVNAQTVEKGSAPVIEAQITKNEAQNKRLTAETKKADAVVREAEKQSDEIGNIEQKIAVNNMKQVVKKAEDCYNRLKTEVETPLNNLIKFCSDDDESMFISDAINELAEKKLSAENLMKEFTDKTQQPIKDFNEAVSYNDDTSTEDLNKKMEILKELMATFDKLVETYRSKYKELDADVDNISLDYLI